MDKYQVQKIKNIVSNKYGNPSYSYGRISLGNVKYEWYMDDDIEIKVYRNWPDTTTYLRYTYPKNYELMVKKQKELQKQKKLQQYNQQNDAF